MATYRIKRFSFLQKIKEKISSIHKNIKNHFIDFFKKSNLSSQKISEPQENSIVKKFHNMMF